MNKFYDANWFHSLRGTEKVCCLGRGKMYTAWSGAKELDAQTPTSLA